MIECKLNKDKGHTHLEGLIRAMKNVEPFRQGELVRPTTTSGWNRKPKQELDLGLNLMVKDVDKDSCSCYVVWI